MDNISPTNTNTPTSNYDVVDYKELCARVLKAEDLILPGGGEFWEEHKEEAFALSKLINDIRIALGDSAPTEKIVESLPSDGNYSEGTMWCGHGTLANQEKAKNSITAEYKNHGVPHYHADSDLETSLAICIEHELYYGGGPRAVAAAIIRDVNWGYLQFPATHPELGEEITVEEIDTIWDEQAGYFNLYSEARRFARVIIALDRSRRAPVQPPEREVVELMEWLENQASMYEDVFQSKSGASRLRRTIALLQPLQPISVNDRLPELEDCDPYEFCWWWTPCIQCWEFRSRNRQKVHNTHWLPARTLPNPTEEFK